MHILTYTIYNNKKNNKLLVINTLIIVAYSIYLRNSVEFRPA